jgi:hypothetical protein
LTDEQVASLGGDGKAFPVTVTVNGIAHPLRLARMGGEKLIGLSKAARAAAGVEIGSSYAVVVEFDGDPRKVEVPDDLARALTAGKAEKAFAALAPSHRKEFVRWISEAKKDQTRADRVARAVAMVRDGKTR